MMREFYRIDDRRLPIPRTGDSPRRHVNPENQSGLQNSLTARGIGHIFLCALSAGSCWLLLTVLYKVFGVDLPNPIEDVMLGGALAATLYHWCFKDWWKISRASGSIYHEGRWEPYISNKRSLLDQIKRANNIMPEVPPALTSLREDFDTLLKATFLTQILVRQHSDVVEGWKSVNHNHQQPLPQEIEYHRKGLTGAQKKLAEIEEAFQKLEQNVKIIAAQQKQIELRDRFQQVNETVAHTDCKEILESSEQIIQLGQEILSADKEIDEHTRRYLQS